jgi:hypothetical protein
MLRSSLHGFIPGSAQEAGHREAFGQVLLVVPAIELVLFVGRDIGPDDQQPCTFFFAMAALLFSAVRRYETRGRTVRPG